jgi:non-specific serine/threonine protein kinase
MSHPAGRLQTRVFRVGAIQVDEAAQELRVDGQRRDLEAKPLAVLMVLLTRAGTRVSKRSLIEAVWGNPDHISEASLTTAISKLRAALGGAGRELIDMVPGAGYRIAAPVEIFASRAGTAAFAFSPGESVPGRPQWRLERLLGAAPLNDVWLARHAKTGERRVFKFADSTIRLETLQREAALSRVLHAALGPRDDLIRILEWNFDQRPYFMESAYGGLCMPLWADSRGGLAAIPIGERLLVVARIARTLAAAHSAGVIHGDIKPTNVLIEAPDGRFDAAAADRPTYVRLVDFGAGGVSDATRLAQLAISGHGLADPSGARASGTVRYLAPEVLAGGVPTTAADIYALGMLLFQLAAADLDKTIAPGWEDVIADELLREDIAAAAAGDPARRLASATLLAERLETLAARHAARRAAQLARAHAADLARQVERARLRRPWILLAAASLAAGLALSAGFGISAVHDRDIAERREAVVQAVNGFLTEDLLGRGNPANSGKADETLMDAAQAAEAGIDRRLAHDPMVAGAIYLSLARAFDSRSSYAAARNAYDRAIAAFGRAGSMPARLCCRCWAAMCGRRRSPIPGRPIAPRRCRRFSTPAPGWRYASARRSPICGWGTGPRRSVYSRRCCSSGWR